MSTQYPPLAEPFPLADTPSPQQEIPTPPQRPRRSLGDGSTFYGQADAVVTPDLVAHLLVSPLPRPRLSMAEWGGLLPILDAAPFPGDLATTVVEGTLPCAIIPSGMTPGDDTDG